MNEPGRVVRELLDVHLHQATGTPEGWREAAHQTCLLADDAWRLAAMARECRGPLLELGTRHGLTAALFALCGLDVVTVDIEASPWRTRVWDACGVSGRVLAVEDGEIPPGPYGSAFIDADHSYDGCRRHWDEVEPHLQAGAIVLLDDMDYPAGGGRFWREVGAEDFGRFGRLRT